jgi:hypothetical protein
MSREPLITRPNTKALAGGIFAYVVLHWILLYGLISLSHLFYSGATRAEQKILFAESPLAIFFPVLVIVQYFIPGLVAGFMARCAGLMHGLITGTCLPVVTAVFMWNEIRIAPGLAFNVLFMTLIVGLLLSSIAGVIGEVIAIKFRRE